MIPAILINAAVATQAAAAEPLSAAGDAAPELNENAAKSLKTLGDVIQFEAVGVIIVLGALGSLWILCELIGLVFKRVEAAAAAKRAAAEPEYVPHEEEVPVAAIAAAVAIALDRPHRIVAIGAGTSGWSAEGRREHFLSHRVR
ncbi:MAG: hypothetical protein PF961_17800 [Planctomycetota bacterium]|jgi:hypothetical protein|nr:hypothetical protein [Planctomycetota bacterium]